MYTIYLSFICFTYDPIERGGACSVLYAVPRADDSVLNPISACQSDDWEGSFCCITDIIKYLFAHNLPQPPTPSN